MGREKVDRAGRTVYPLEKMRANHAKLVAESPPHRRPVGVYEAPTTPYEVLTWNDVADAEFDPDVKLDAVPMYWTAVRGTKYVDATTVPIPMHATFKVMFELAPEWSNPHDSSAVAVQLHNVRIGYVAARISWRVHEMVADMNDLGLQVLLPGEYCADYYPETRTIVPNSWIVMPTWQNWNQIYIEARKKKRQASAVREMPRWESELMKIWMAAGEPLRESVASHGYHLDLTQAREFIAHRDVAPGSRLPGRLDSVEDLPLTLNRFLERRRLERRAREAGVRRELLEQSVKLWQGGSTQKEAAEALGLSPGAVSKAVKLAIAAKADGEKAAQVVALWRGGLSKGVISRRLLLSSAAVSEVLKREL